MNTVAPAADERAAAAYDWARGLITLASRLLDDGIDVDLAPIRPAIRELCEIIRTLPKAEAEGWLTQLVELQHALAALVQRLANRENAHLVPEA